MLNSLLEDPAWDIRLDIDEKTLCLSRCKEPLSFDSQSLIIEGLHRDMGGSDVREYFAKQPAIFSQYDLLVIALSRQDAVPIGLLGGRWYEMDGQKILYVWTIFIAKTRRSTRLLPDMISLFGCAGLEAFPKLIALKTYSPRVYRIMTRLANASGFKLYPKIPAAVQDPEMVALSTRAMSLMFPNLRFFPNTGLVLGGQASVGIGVFPEMPRVRDSAVMQYFERHLSPEDQIFVLFKPHADQSDGGSEQLIRALSPSVSRALGAKSTSLE